MIRRDAGPNFHLIPQHNHALLAAKFAQHLGKNPFTQPSPHDLVMQAIANHDAGWQSHDNTPILNPTHYPLHVFEAPISLAVQVWSASVEQAKPLGDYTTLLVSLHVMNLANIDLTHTKNPTRSDIFEINKFQHDQVEIQEHLRNALNLSNDHPRNLGLADPNTAPEEDLLRFNFRLLTFMDRISLALCCGKHLFPNLIDIHPASGKKPVPIKATMPTPSTMTLTPWPFTQSKITEKIPAKKIPKKPYKSIEDFQATYHSTPTENLELTITQP